MALIVCGGSFTWVLFGWRVVGAQLLPETQDHHTRVHKGSQVSGGACRATPEAPVLFHKQALHAPLPWERWRWRSVIPHQNAIRHHLEQTQESLTRTPAIAALALTPLLSAECGKEGESEAVHLRLGHPKPLLEVIALVPQRPNLKLSCNTVACTSDICVRSVASLRSYCNPSLSTWSLAAASWVRPKALCVLPWSLAALARGEWLCACLLFLCGG